MLHHAYIDESGTKDDQEVMIVALVVFEGKRSAEKAHLLALQQVFPGLDQMGKNKRHKNQKQYLLHYADMSESHKLAVGRCLAQFRISCYASCYWHDGTEKDHCTRFEICTELLKSCIASSFEHYDNIELLIAQQGGASRYKKEFLAKLRLLAEAYSKKKTFKKARFDLATTPPGIQIADFYAGAIRDYLRSHSAAGLQSAYELVENQVVCIKTVGYKLP